jgi:coenzyme PQQ precursor peptide PqqA
MSKKIWSKPTVTGSETSLEVTRYLPSEFDKAAKQSCK